jgi:hypothetical protein
MQSLALGGSGCEGLGWAAVALVLGDVVAAAAQLEVVEVGGAAVDPVDPMVGVAPLGGHGAAGFDAGVVAGVERPSLHGGGLTGAPADVEDFRSAAHDHAPHGGVAGQPQGGVAVERADAGQPFPGICKDS